MKLAARLQSLAPSGTLAVSARAEALRRSGVDVVSFAAGEPDFDTPPYIVEAMAAAARRGATRYPPALGLPELRDAVTRHLSARYRVPLPTAEIAITPGAKYALWAAFQALVEPGDEVLVPTPCWVSYGPQIALAQGRMVPVPMAPEDGWRLSAEALANAITPRTVGIVLNLPTNPTGQLASPEALDAIARLAIEHDLWLLCDDIYAELRFDPTPPFPSPLLARPELAPRTLIVDGLAKSHAMTGWRLGYIRAPEPVLGAIGRLLGQTATGVTTFAQHGALAALEGPDSFVAASRAAYAQRAAHLHAGLASLGLHAVPPEGAFYLLADVRPWLAAEGPLLDDHALALHLLDDFHLATVPGSAFHAPGFLRMSFACSDANLDEGLVRLARFLRSR